MTPLGAWFFIAVVIAGLYVFWLSINLTFNLIERALRQKEEQ